ncbi:uncharacterized protein LOC119441447 [Dermacentor silvarum]|uniref:uncharacterized protein LOC119441447 n=1 Tax=Dermacentor silvarum TaxID=543639 RepID=UPI002101A840|nr:uncharacterized protein LOC119441447 [Dermacentor silvarum]
MASPAAFGDSSVFSASVSGTGPLFVRAVFHDGAQKRWTTRHDTWTVRFSRLYATTGSFHVTLSCTNRAGSVTRFAVAVVEEPVSGLRLRVRKPASFPLVPLDETVELEAELISGTGLTFRWKMDDGRSINEPATVETRGRTSIARHRFSAAGTYSVSVSASNALLTPTSARPVAHIGRPLRVVEAIDGLAADVIGGRYVVLLQPCRNSGDSGNEGNASLVTTPSSMRGTGRRRRRRTGEHCLRDCGQEERHPSEDNPLETWRSL